MYPRDATIDISNMKAVRERIEGLFKDCSCKIRSETRHNVMKESAAVSMKEVVPPPIDNIIFMTHALKKYKDEFTIPRNTSI